MNISNRTKCRITKLMALFMADLYAKRILKNPSHFDDVLKYYTIEAISNIRKLYLDEFKDLL